MTGKVQTGREEEEEEKELDRTRVHFSEDAEFPEKREPKKKFARFGNYYKCYIFPLGKTLDEDPRLKFFEREWFEAKDCLDIGCNEGFVTISIEICGLCSDRESQKQLSMVHLNWGDRGLVRLFAKIYHILRPGGILILEPQSWSSYERKAHVSKVTRRIFSVIRIRPCHFTKILLEKIGFKSFKQVRRAVLRSSTGFDRPIFRYVK